jgi:hypothetical protein
MQQQRFGAVSKLESSRLTQSWVNNGCLVLVSLGQGSLPCLVRSGTVGRAGLTCVTGLRDKVPHNGCGCLQRCSTNPGMNQEVEQNSLVERRNLFFRAKLSSQAQRHEDCLRLLHELSCLGVELSQAERALFARSFKKAFLQRVQSLRGLLYSDLVRNSAYETFIGRLEQDCLAICQDAIACLDQLLGLPSIGAEFRVFCLRLRGDYCRYQVQLLGANHPLVGESELAYKTASAIAERHLSPAHPERLRTHLNFALFLRRTLTEDDKAFLVTKEALGNAFAIDLIPQASLSVLEQLTYNLCLWARPHEGPRNITVGHQRTATLPPCSTKQQCAHCLGRFNDACP